MTSVLGDWQFWVVTAVAAAGLYVLVRPLLPKKTAEPACGHCDGCSEVAPSPPLVRLGKDKHLLS